MNKDDLLKIRNHNGETYNKLKLIEELNELSTALVQSLTKNDDNSSDIVEEFGDVKYRMKIFELYLDKDEVKERVEKKFNKSLGYLTSKKYAKV